MKIRQKRNLKRGLIVAGVVIAIIVVSFVLMVLLKKPAGKMEVAFNIEVGMKPQTIQMDPSGSKVFIGGPEGNFKIISDKGKVETEISLGRPVLEVKIDPTEKIAIVRTLFKLSGYTYDGKLSWELEVADYLPEKVQILPRGRVGIYLRSGRGDEPMIKVVDSATGIEEKSMLLAVQQTDINPSFMPDGQSIVFEVIPGMIVEATLTDGLPIVWKAHLDTYDNRFSKVEPVVTNSNLVVVNLRVDSKSGVNESFREIYAFDPATLQEQGVDAETATPELAPFWMKRVEGEIRLLTVNPSEDIVLVQADDVTIFNRSGEVLVKETTNTGFFHSYLGNSRYMTSYFLESATGALMQVLISSKGIGREGILWRRSEALTNNILPILTPDLEKMLMVIPESGRLVMLKMTY